MAKILNYQNYHKITVVAEHQRHQSHPRTRPRTETETQQQQKQQQLKFKQRQQFQTINANQGKTLHTTHNSANHYRSQRQAKENTQHVARSTQYETKLPQQQQQQHLGNIDRSIKHHSNHYYNNHNQQLTSMDKSGKMQKQQRKQQYSSKHNKHLLKSKNNNQPASNYATATHSTSSNSASRSTNSTSTHSITSISPSEHSESTKSSSTLSPLTVSKAANSPPTLSSTSIISASSISTSTVPTTSTISLPMLSSTLPSSSSSSLPPPTTTTTAPNTIYATYSTTSSCCVILTYNLFAAYAEAATLQLKRKTSLNKLFYANGSSGAGQRRHTDMSSICYLILMAFVYWGVMIKAAVATTPVSRSTTASTTTTTAAITPTATSSSSSTMHPIVEPLANLTAAAVHFSLNAANERASLVPPLGFGVGGGNATTTTTTNNPNSLRSHLPISSVSSDILTNYQRRLLTRREAANVPDFEDDDSSYHDDEFDEYETLIRNKSAKGKYIGAPCNNMTCEPTLLHVTCDKETQICGCERSYPVQIGLTRGCDKPKKLGEMCFFDETCQYNDENSLCVQVRHNAMCQCANGYHSVSYNKPTRRVFCTQDLDELNSDLPTLLGVCVGIGVLAGLICMVLHLFSKTKYPRHRNFGDANLPPPIMYSSETVQSGRPSSRSSIRSSGGSIGSYGNRRSSTGGVTATTAGSKGILVSTSRTGSRRPSLASVHSTSSSVRSYSMMRFEKEQQQKEIRHEMKLRLARLQQHQQQQHLGQYKPQIIIGDTALSMQQHGVALNRITMATPSPMTPNSTDELLPAVDENQEYPPSMEPQIKPCPESVASVTLSAIKNAATGASSTGANPKYTSTTSTTTNNMATAANAAIAATAATTTDMANAAAYIGPCSSSTEAL